MPKFGKRSEDCIETLHPDLQKVLRLAIEGGPDFGIICGHRGREAQEECFARGVSKKRFPESRHNSSPSEAFDLIPSGGADVWGDHVRFGLIAGWILSCANSLGVSIRWGGDWRRNYRQSVSGFFDGGHFELTETEED